MRQRSGAWSPAGTTTNSNLHPLDPNQPGSLSAYEYLLNALEGSNVVFEMDIHWVAFAGQNPVEWMANYPGRFPLWHVKDFAADTCDTGSRGTRCSGLGRQYLPWQKQQDSNTTISNKTSVPQTRPFNVFKKV
jgi:sugar phosphate isomerase/epimerase